MQRVIVYIDGFNLYYGLRSKGWRRYYWLDLHRFAEGLLRPGQRLVAVHYFTSRVLAEQDGPEKPDRQNTYLEALTTLPNLTIHYGTFQSQEQRCRECGAIWQVYKEKMTDVNIAVEMLADAQDDAFDTAIIVSGDSDLHGPISNIRGRFLHKQVIVAFPPNRVSNKLRQEATASYTLQRTIFRDSQLPEQVAKADGYVLTRPSSWRREEEEGC